MQIDPYRPPGRSVPTLPLIMAALVVLVAVFSTVWWGVDRLLRSHELFRVSQVDLEVPDPELRQEVASRLASWPGANYWEVRSRRDRVRNQLAELPPVAQVVIRTRLPNRVRVRVTPRTAVGQITDGARYILFDADGTLFRVSREGRKGLPTIHGLKLGSDPLGRRLDENESAPEYAVLRCALAVQRLRAQGVPVNLQTVSVSSEGLLQVRWEGGLVVRLGAPLDLEQKLKTAAEIRRLMARSPNVEYVDVSAPRAPVWKPRPES